MPSRYQESKDSLSSSENFEESLTSTLNLKPSDRTLDKRGPEIEFTQKSGLQGIRKPKMNPKNKNERFWPQKTKKDMRNQGLQLLVLLSFLCLASRVDQDFNYQQVKPNNFQAGEGSGDKTRSTTSQRRNFQSLLDEAQKSWKDEDPNIQIYQDEALLQRSNSQELTQKFQEDEALFQKRNIQSLLDEAIFQRGDSQTLMQKSQKDEALFERRNSQELTKRFQEDEALFQRRNIQTLMQKSQKGEALFERSNSQSKIQRYQENEALLQKSNSQALTQKSQKNEALLLRRRNANFPESVHEENCTRPSLLKQDEKDENDETARWLQSDEKRNGNGLDFNARINKQDIVC